MPRIVQECVERMFFFWYKPEEQRKIIAELQRLGRPDLIRRLGLSPANRPTHPHGHKPSKKQ